MPASRPRVFDLRYHLVSLAAVFLALAIGIVVGVAIRKPVSSAESTLLREQNERLEQELGQARAILDAEVSQRSASAALAQSAYPALVAGRLDGRRVGVLFLGEPDGDIRLLIENVLDDAGAGRPAWVVAVELPLDVEGLGELLASSEALTRFAGEDALDELGRTLGRELVQGADAPVLTALSGQLVEERFGSLGESADAVVIVRGWVPVTVDAEPPGDDASAALASGLMRGLEAEGVPAVGAEGTTTEPSAVPFYRLHGLSSVDAVDTVVGRLALVVLLGGGRRGHYGVKETADAVLPPLTVPLPAGGAGA